MFFRFCFLLSLPVSLSQQFYLQVSAWMIRMESELSQTSTPKSFRSDITTRSQLFIQVSD